jgi:hypothetical protein
MGMRLSVSGAGAAIRRRSDAWLMRGDPKSQYLKQSGGRRACTHKYRFSAVLGTIPDIFAANPVNYVEKVRNIKKI